MHKLLKILFASLSPTASRRVSITGAGFEEPQLLSMKELKALIVKKCAVVFCDGPEVLQKLKDHVDVVDESFLRICFPSVEGPIQSRIDSYLSQLSNMPTTLMPLLERVFGKEEPTARFMKSGLEESSMLTHWEEHVCSRLGQLKGKRVRDESVDILDAVKLVFSDNGLLEEIHPSYEFRQEQLQTSMEIAESIALEKGILLESGTGTGKTLAYLVPVAYGVLTSGKRAVISTRTTTLQDQLIQNDVPIMRKLPRLDHLNVASLKGRGRYLCPSRFLSRIRTLLSDQTNLQLTKEALGVVFWSITTSDGDLDRVKLSSRTLELIRTDRFECASRLCGDYDRCPYFIARNNSRKSDIVITSHALLSSEIQMKSPETELANGILLPRFDILVVDEAHGFEKALTDTLTYSVSPGSIRENLGKILSICRDAISGFHDHFEKSFVDSLKSRIEKLHRETLVETRELVESLREPYEKKDMVLSGKRSEEARSHILKIDQLLRSLASTIVQVDEMFVEVSGERDEATDERISASLRTTRSRLFEMIKNTSGFVAQDINRIQFLSLQEASRYGALCSAPIGNDMIVSDVLSTVPVKIFISATMWVFSKGSDGFNYSRRILGLGEDFHALKLGTSFDFESQLRLLLVDDMPEYSQNSPEYLASAADFISSAINIVGGGTAVLFTSYNDMKQVERLIADRMEGITLHSQRPFESASVILSEHITSKQSVIFGTRTFWEGIDLPGDKLKLLIVFKLPFDRPDEPLIRARIRHYGQQSFMEGLHKYYYPKMITMFRQGIGRVIRTREDHGVILVLDRRLADPRRNYSVKLVNSLPDGLKVEKTPVKKALTTLRALKRTGWLS